MLPALPLSTRWIFQGFNPHRPRRAGATGGALDALHRRPVSILTGPGGPVLPSVLGFSCKHQYVSILTGPGGPVLHDAADDPAKSGNVSILTGPGGPVLQPEPDPSAGPHHQVSILTGPGGPVLHDPRLEAVGPRLVSILTGPGGPVLRRRARRLRTRPRVSILTGPGGPVLLYQNRLSNVNTSKFQSSPAPEGRCYNVFRHERHSSTSFNPHRPRRAGATVSSHL